MKGKPQSIFILCTLNLLTACQTKMPTPPIRSYPASLATTVAISPRCQSFNLGDNLQGRAVVLIPVTDSSIRFFWVRQNSQGKWSIAEKQTVMQIQPGRLDASPMHRLYYNTEQQKVVLFITLPSGYWQQGITIQPILEETESRWGQVQPFNTGLTAQGFAHPFKGIDQGLSGNTLPPNLTAIMNHIEPGSVYVPRIYTNKINLLKPSLVNRKLCPIAG